MMKKEKADGFMPLTPATLHILGSVAAGPMHGYAIKRDVEDRTNGVIRLGASTLYSGIQRMERDGLIEETQVPGERSEDAGSRWRFYAITDRGREVLHLELARLERELRLLHARIPDADLMRTT